MKQNPFEVICINDQNRPDGIPTSKWIKKGNPYTVVEVAKLIVQGGIIGFKLAEIDLSDCAPYQFFDSSRFALSTTAPELKEKVSEKLELVE
jgi:hypothetical protein